MIKDTEEEFQLGKWITHHLNQIKQSNPDEISKYVLSLVKQNATKEKCIAELKSLLKEKTESFVEILFSSILDGSFKNLENNNSDEDEENNHRRSRRYSPTGSDDDINNSYEEYEDEDRDRSRFRRRDSDSRFSNNDDSFNEDEVETKEYKNKQYENRHSKFSSGSNISPKYQKQRTDYYQGKNHNYYDRNFKSSANYEPTPPTNYFGMQKPPPPPGGAMNQIGQYGWGYPMDPGMMYGNMNYMYGNGPMFYPGMMNQPGNMNMYPPVIGNNISKDSNNSEIKQGEPQGMGMSSQATLDGSVSEDTSTLAQPPISPPPSIPSYPMSYPYSVPNMFPHEAQFLRGQNKFHSKKKHSNGQLSTLPEHERCTLKCIKIPPQVTEEELREHFESFGHVIELQLSPMVPTTSSDSDDHKKSFNECLVQFLSYQNAKKCLNSPIPVLNNRFIKLIPSSFNITQISDVPVPSYKVIENDKRLLHSNNLVLGSSLGGKKRPGPPLNLFSGSKHKYVRKEETELSSKSVDESVSPQDNNEVGSQLEPNHSIETESERTETKIPELTVEKKEVVSQYDELKTLRKQAEDILIKKEGMLQSQIEKCKELIAKLEKSEDSEKRNAILDDLEKKNVYYNAQLIKVRNQLKHGATLSDKSQSPIGKNNRGGFGFKGNTGGRKFSNNYLSHRFYSGRGRGGRGGRFFSNSATKYVASKEEIQADQERSFEGTKDEVPTNDATEKKSEPSEE